jgi:redox-sensing transcriptional repressor
MTATRDVLHKEAVSELTTQRLSVYLRCLSYLETHGVTTVSSHELARRFHLNSAQIRKDLACFGEMGIRGVGYDVARLKQHLIRTLGLDPSTM